MQLNSLGKAELLAIKKQVEKALEDSHEAEQLKINVHIQRDKIKLLRNKWLFLFQDTEFLLARCLKPSACKVIMFFRAACKYENRVEYDIKTIGEVLGLTRQSVSIAIKELEDKGIILTIKDPLDSRRNTYVINPETSWKGKLKELKAIQQVFNDDGKFIEFRKVHNPNQMDLLDAIAEEKRLKEG